MMRKMTPTGCGRILCCPLGPSTREMKRCGFGQTLFDGMSAATPLKIALAKTDARQSTTFDRFIADAELIARHLLRHGCRKGDVIAIFAPNSIEWMLVFAASLRVGIVPVAIGFSEKPEELNQRLLLSGATYILTSGGRHLETTLKGVAGSDIRTIICTENYKEIRNGEDVYPECISYQSLLKPVDDLIPVLPEFNELHLRPQDVAVIMFSSGTTGKEKAVLLSHQNLQAQFVVCSDEKVGKVTDNQIVFAPLYHLGGGVMTLYGLALGYTTHLMTQFQLKPYLETLAENKNESIAIVPSVALALAKAEKDVLASYDLSSLKDILCGTARLSKEVEELLYAKLPGISIRQGYGLTETTAACVSVPRFLETCFARSKSGSIGVPLFNVEIKVIDPMTGAILGAREDGELLIRSPLVMKGYGDRQGLLRSETIDQEGWLHTGDLGYYDNDGYLWIVDRIKDIITCNSIKVSPSTLESLLLSHADVADAAVFPVQDTTSGDELPAAWVVKKIGALLTKDELESYVSDRVAWHQRLRGGITFVESIPRSANGKIMRNKIQQQAASSLHI